MILRGLLPLLACLGAAAIAGPVDGDFVFQSGSGGYHTFRIPAAVRTPRGTVLAFAEGRVSGAGDAGNIDLVLKRSTDDGKSWSPLQVVWDDGENACANPCPVVIQETGEILLLAVRKKAGLKEKDILTGAAENRVEVFLFRSRDEGETWTAPQRIPEASRESWRWYATGPGNGIELRHGPHKGRLVIPANHSELLEGGSHYDAHVLYSDDRGQTWKLSGTGIAAGANESAVAELPNGTLFLSTRMQENGAGKRGEALSRDGGASWEGFRKDGPLSCPRCEASLLAWEFPGSGPCLLFSNPQGQGRSDLTVQLSFDGGKTWPRRLLAAPGPSYGYTSLVPLDRGRFGLLFEGVPAQTGGILWRAFGAGDLKASP